MKNRLSIIFLTTGILIQLCASGQNNDSIEIKKVETNLIPILQITGEPAITIEERMQYYHVQGLSIAVIKDFKLLWAKGFGWADDSLKIPVTTKTLFQAASISKSFNAVGVLKLVQDKKLDLDGDINNYLRTWKFPYDSLSKGKKITIKNLLSHTGGLTVHGFDGYGRNDPLPALQQILDGQKPANSPPVRSMYEPGMKHEYSGGGTTISQMIVTDVTHESYTDYMKKHVLLPMQMTQSTFTQPPIGIDTVLLSSGYYSDGKPIPGRYHIYPEEAPAGLWTNPTELAKFIIEIQLAYQGKSEKVLNQKTTQLMLTPYINNGVGLGVFISDSASTQYFSHSGSNLGFVSLYDGSFTGGNGIIVMANTDNGAILQEIINSIATVYGFKGLLFTSVKTIVKVDTSVLKKYTGIYKSSPDFTVNIALDGNQLYVEPKGQDKFEIFPESTNKFFRKQSPPIDIAFISDDKGHVTSVIFNMPWRKIEMKRTELKSS